MVPDLNNLPRFFRELNKEVFSRELTCPSFEIIHKKDTIGQFRFRNEHGNVVRPIIKVTDKYDFTECELKDIICHEMIHYLLAKKGIDMKCSHGNEFKELMNTINDKYKMSVSIYSNDKAYKLSNG